MKTELVIGCGSKRKPVLSMVAGDDEYHNPTYVDLEPRHNPDVLHDLNVTPWPFEDNTFDEVHAYEVLEHLGKQGDAVSFFATFAEIYRILKPGGVLLATVPAYNSRWAWGDPTHTRVINDGSLVFLCQPEYRQIGATAMSDYRSLWQDDFDVLFCSYDTLPDRMAFALQAVKPSRCTV